MVPLTISDYTHMSILARSSSREKPKPADALTVTGRILAASLNKNTFPQILPHLDIALKTHLVYIPCCLKACARGAGSKSGSSCCSTCHRQARRQYAASSTQSPQACLGLGCPSSFCCRTCSALSSSLTWGVQSCSCCRSAHSCLTVLALSLPRLSPLNAAEDIFATVLSSKGSVPDSVPCRDCLPGSDCLCVD